ncbi:ribosome maturation factor RimM [Sneathiella sp. CAU 1612]|uniref:Ribosome maturation factor RimM n=1 Tax=Sneathiella sedimenti TaxID=2816034 RepID=A0ABS3F1Q5_9PROT|nr:ribosome maturation factor RimM [Sneathiella sedimenti]MBO0332445.1 ribosome maturation factor RimM [Sneathiella sedimenti]
MPQADMLLLGVIVGAKGIKGEVKVKSFTEQPEDIAAYGPLKDASGKSIFELKVVGLSKGLPVARIKGISDRNAAESLKGTELYVSRDRLPETKEEEEYYHADLIGLPVFFQDGTKFGTILRLHDFGAGDMLEIVPEGKGAKAAVLVPFTVDLVPEVDISGGRVVVELDEDFFEVPENPENTVKP